MFTEADADEFSALLVEAFPDIRFLPHSLSNRVDGDLDASAPYLPSLGVPGEEHFVIWREPKDWRPLWLPLPKGDGIYIANRPRLQFTFYRSHVSTYIENFTGTEITNLAENDIWAYYFREDREHIQFLGQVWRIAAKMATNILDWDWPKTGERAKAVRTHTWVGPNALRWAGADPNRRLAGRYRPLGSVDEPRPPRSLEEIYGPELAAIAAEGERRSEERRRAAEERRKMLVKRRAALKARNAELPDEIGSESNPQPPPQMNE